jgi:two-component system, LuxR family, response regulator FixJ
VSEAKQQKVAVVDDDLAVRDSLQCLLEVMGYLVETFESAIKFLNANMENLGCIILDHHMPNMTGLELAERLRAGGATIPILLITGSPSRAVVDRAADLGIKVIDKPPGDDDLLNFIEATRS